MLFGEASPVCIVQLHQHEYFPALCPQEKEKGYKEIATWTKKQEQIPVAGNQGPEVGSAQPRWRKMPRPYRQME